MQDIEKKRNYVPKIVIDEIYRIDNEKSAIFLIPPYIIQPK